MKKEDLQNSQQGTGSSENRASSDNEQRNTNINMPDNQQNGISRQAGLGRDRLTDIEDLGGMNERDYAGGDEDLTNENLNAANDQ